MPFARNCEFCGKGFVANRSDKRYCDLVCAKKHAGQKRSAALADWRECGVCGKQFNAKQYQGSGKFCSRECGFIGQRRNGPGDTQWIHWWFGNCAVCGVFFRKASRQTLMCGEECRSEFERRRSRDHYHKTKKLSVGEVHCRECGKTIRFLNRSGQRKYCSKACAFRCSHRDAKHRRKQRVRSALGVSLGLDQLISRDRGRCALCGRKVAVGKKAPHPLSPTVDHIIPLSMGGAHDQSNLQLAHFECNWRKGASEQGQMWLGIAS